MFSESHSSLLSKDGCKIFEGRCDEGRHIQLSDIIFPYILHNHFVGIHKVISSDFDWSSVESLDQGGEKWCLDSIRSS